MMLACDIHIVPNAGSMNHSSSRQRDVRYVQDDSSEASSPRVISNCAYIATTADDQRRRS